MSLLIQIPLVAFFIGLYILGVLFFRRQRAWLFYYVFAALGLTVILIFLAQWTGLAGRLEAFVTYSTTMLASAFGISARWLGQSTFMVQDSAGWVVLETNIECSALIEISLLAGLLFYYPAFAWRKKIEYFSIGLVVTVIANSFRMLIIAVMAAEMGRQVVFIGHAIVGRLFFFIVIIVLYWYILTRPTVKKAGEMLEEAQAT